MAIKKEPFPLIHIVVLKWNGADDALACLDSLSALTWPNFQIIVVGNGSTDDSLAKLRAYSRPYPLVLLETGQNLRYDGGDNIDTRHALVPNVVKRTNCERCAL